MKKIVLASNNSHKVKEIKEVLNDYEIITLNDIGYYEEIEETGETFLENALIKAKTIHEYLNVNNMSYPVISDDSGLVLDSLDGMPGIFSARYAGVHGDNVKNRKKLQENLVGKNKDAYFLCTIVYYDEDGTYKSFVGKTYGKIISEERGDKSFGYDCIFYSNDLNKTFGEASDEEKNKVSHRARALKELKNYLENL